MPGTVGPALKETVSLGPCAIERDQKRRQGTSSGAGAGTEWEEVDAKERARVRDTWRREGFDHW